MKKKLFPILLSLLIAFILWSYVIIVIGPEYQDTFYDIKVDLESVSKALDEEGKMILLTDEASVTLVLSGNRVDLNKLNSGNVYMTVDPSKLTPGKSDYRVEISYPDNVSDDAFSIEGQYPSMISLDVAWRAEKTVKVEVNFDEDMIPEGYGNLPVEAEFSDIFIVGPEDVINQIAVARVDLELTEENNKTGIHNQEFKLTFCDEEGNAVDSHHVRVPKDRDMITISLPIYMKKVIPLKVHVKEGGGATLENNVTISPSAITILGSEEALTAIDEWYLNTEETALDLLTAEAGTITYELKNLPEGIVNRSGKETADVTVSFDNLKLTEYKLKLNTIRQENLPAGLYPDISEEEITITIRGTEERIKALRLSNIEAFLDFSDAKNGQMKEWPVTISISGNPKDIGVIGTYAVWVEITNTPPPDPAAEE